MILVIGQPRSGTSLLMQMLNVAGARCPGEFPAFEDERFKRAPYPLAELGERDAVKIVWTTDFAVPRDAICLLTDRRAQTMVQSQWKFMHCVTLSLPSYPPISTAQRRKMIRYSIGVRGQILGAVHQRRISIFPFEQVLSDPLTAAERMARRIGFGDPEAMAACVRKRSRGNYPGFLEVEMALQGAGG